LILELEEEQKYMDVDLINVPPLITKVWGALSLDKFNYYKCNESWLKFTTKVCD